MMKSPNLLHNLLLTSKQQPMSCIGLLILCITAVIFLITAQVFMGITFLTIGAVLLILFTFKLEWGMYALTASSFFLGLEVSLSRYDATRDIPYLSSLNAPLVDFLAVLLLLSVAIGWFLHIKPFRMEQLLRSFPGIQWYGLFLLSALLSLAFVYDHNIGTGIKYFLRAMLFSYIAFVWLPVVAIRNDELLERLLRIWAWVGIGIALFGISSLLVVSHGGWVRFVPYGVFGIAPLGYNHNLLAEPLVALLPITIYAASQTTDVRWKRVLWIGAILMVGIALFTLSRAAWIVLAVQAVAAFLLMKDRVSAVIAAHPWTKILPVIVAIPISIYMVLFLQSSIVTSSTTARLAATKVAAFYASRSPLIGYGPGSYLQVLSDTAWYRLDFGDPLESHGFLQKIGLEEGAIGLFFFLGFLVWVLYSIWQSAAGSRGTRRMLFHALFLSVLGIIIFQLFNTSYFNSVMWLPIGVALAATRLTQERRR